LNFRILIIFPAVALLFGVLPAYAGPVIIGGDDLTDHGSSAGPFNAAHGGCEGTNFAGWLYIQNGIENLLRDETRPGTHTFDIFAIGSEKSLSVTCGGNAGVAIASAAFANSATVRFCEGSAGIDACFADLATDNPRVLWIAGTGASNDISGSEGGTINSHAQDISDFVASGGGLMAHGSGSAAFGWISTLLPGFLFGGSCSNSAAVLTPAGIAAFPLITNANIRSGPCHDSFSGNFGGLEVFAFDTLGRPFIMGLKGGEGGTIEKGLIEETKFRLLGHDNVKHEILTINTLTGLASVLGATGFDSGASGLATSRVSLDTAIGTFPKDTHFGVFMDDTPPPVVIVGSSIPYTGPVDGIIGPGSGGVSVQDTGITTDGTWFEFSTDGFITRGCAPADPAGANCIASTGTPTTFVGAPAWTFTCPADGCTLTVTDAFDYRDQFDVFDNTVLIGTTSAIAATGSCGNDPVPCLADPNSSSGVFPLGAGPHSITIFEADSAIAPGGAHYLKVVEGGGPESDSGKDFIVVVDPATGFSTKVVAVDMGTGAVGVAFGEDNLFYVTDGTADKLYTVDLVTGLKTFKGDFKDSITGDPVKIINNLQFDPESSKFIAIGIASPQSVYSIDTDGTATKIAELDPTVEDVCAIARTPDTGEWFSVKQGSNELVKIDIVTGEL